MGSCIKMTVAESLFLRVEKLEELITISRLDIESTNNTITWLMLRVRRKLYKKRKIERKRWLQVNNKQTKMRLRESRRKK